MRKKPLATISTSPETLPPKPRSAGMAAATSRSLRRRFVGCDIDLGCVTLARNKSQESKAYPFQSSDQLEMRQGWRTDPAVFATLHKVFRFTIDACATKNNALLPRYWTREMDAALQDWRGERVFCNPPFARAIVERIIERAPEATLAVMVLKLNSLTTRYFHKTPSTYLLIPPTRLQFVPPPGLKHKKGSLAFGTCLLVWGRITKQQRKQLEQDWLIYKTTKFSS